ncbi:hypothetical protein PG993_005764 [Apiospora rasikravindrae]|uniref:Ubiquitin-like domain-containing protein n=1 Tax=Apiospora rasikravindrae TaxID=990691 RepID=A0ABR1T9Q0_9PEZI
MSASFSFGSFGDIITTARGSAPEFRELVKELYIFYGALNEITKFWQSRSQTAALQRLAADLQHVADDCRRMIESFLEKGLKRYGTSFLKPATSPNSFGDRLKRIRWAMLEKEEVAKMKDQLQRSKNIVDLIHSVAQGYAEEQNSVLVTTRLAALEEAGKLVSVRLEENFVTLVAALRKQEAIISRMDDTVAAILSESQSTVARLSNLEQNTALLPTINAGISMYSENHVVIEDALGYKFPVPLLINPSWETVHSMVKDMFKNRPGMDMVLQRDYVLQDPNTRSDLQLAVEFHSSVRPGQRLIMAMVFRGSADNSLKGTSSGGNICPKCGLSPMDLDPTGSDRFCQNTYCGFSYREIIDMSDASIDELKDWLERRRTTPNYYGDVETSVESESQGDEDLHRILSKRQSMDSPEIFKRVRFLSRWEDRDDSRGPHSGLSFNNVHFWLFSKEGWIPEIQFQLYVMTWIHLSLLEFRSDSISETSRSLFGTGIVLRVVFAGYRKTMSIPVIMIIGVSPRHRKQALTLLRELEPIKSSRIGVLALHPSDLAPEDYWERLQRDFQMDLAIGLVVLTLIDACARPLFVGRSSNIQTMYTTVLFHVLLSCAFIQWLRVSALIVVHEYWSQSFGREFVWYAIVLYLCLFLVNLSRLGLPWLFSWLGLRWACPLFFPPARRPAAPGPRARSQQAAQLLVGREAVPRGLQGPVREGRRDPLGEDPRGGLVGRRKQPWLDA